MLNVQLVQKCLETTSYQLIVAHFGEEGRALAVTHQPDLIMIDLTLPDMTGFEVIEHLRHVPSMMHIPILVLTADSSEKSMQRAEALGCQGYLTKPISRRLLIRTLDKHLHPIAVAL